MTKDQYQKYNRLLQWWAFNPSNEVLCRPKNKTSSAWTVCDDPKFHEEFDYIQNDSIVGIRKAAADGETIQVQKAPGAVWVDIKNDFIDTYGGANVRVKPKELFKIGDWVIFDDAETYRLLYENEVKQANEHPQIAKWEPRLGDNCFFFNDKADIHSYKIGEYGGYRDATTHLDNYTGKFYSGVAPITFDVNMYVK